MNSNPYTIAQRALANLKGAIHEVLADAPDEGLTNSEVGRKLGIYAGHVGHEGHISRTLLGIMQAEGVVLQHSESKRWSLVFKDRNATTGEVAAVTQAQVR